MAARRITEINIHCAATKPGWMAGRPGLDKVAEIRRWHVQDTGWSDIGYHYVIDRDGGVYRGRSEQKVGAFEPKTNARAIGICLVGGYGSSATDAFSQHYTPEQEATLRRLISALQDKHAGITRVTGHNDYSTKACPGFKVDRWLKNQPARVFTESKTAAGSGAAVAAGGGLAGVEVVKLLSEATTETKTAVTEAQAAKAEAMAAPADPLRWVLLAVIIIGAGVALYQRWRDWQAGRQ
jgi:hypothetical protein